MTALEFWDEANAATKQSLIERAGVDDTEWEQNAADMPFWQLPVVLKATIYNSHEFRKGVE